ncbi:MAG TPA: hypothetical protein VJY54_03120 [Lachnospiraceae bacterium]|nr:hypothetical protein [Lachnospiraceae bacterium]
MEQLEGAFLSKKKDGSIYYRSSVTYKGKHISLGSYHSALLAHKAYLEANRILRDPLIPALTDYTSQNTLPFTKWVVLLNFRINKLYFSTPIYIRPYYFYYYYSYELVLKFDIDDLFYYASHKIMKRGGHLFVADFGMQVNILNRYGIKNYAVLGRDYCFRNEDPTDFRRENLIIKNKYHGVVMTHKKNLVQYSARIHVKGNYLIGTYASMEEAAIAYNKAIDILKRNGCKKNYVPNYLEDVPAAIYADIYTKLPVSLKLASLFF